MTILTAAFTLLLVMDPLGNIPVFIPALREVPEERRNKVIMRELFIALGVLVFFLFMGKFMLHLLGLDEVSLNVAGGIVLFIISINMIFPSKDDGFSGNPGGEPFIVPLAIPLVAGPSAMSTVMILANNTSHSLAGWLVAILLAWLVNAFILLFSGKVSRFLGERGMIAVTKLMGMVLTTMAVQMFIRGVQQVIRH